MLFRLIKASVLREVGKLSGRYVYIFSMIVIPLAGLFIMTSLMAGGLPMSVPTAVVDLDNTHETRAIVRQLEASPEIQVVSRPGSYAEALAQMRRGEIFGFFIIPADYTRDNLSGRDARLSYYTNSTFFVPASLLYRGLKTNATVASADVVRAYLLENGSTVDQAQAMLQPVHLQTNLLGNPWSNYAVYICNSFVPALLALMIHLVTAFSICVEEKRGTSQDWLDTAGGSIIVALFGKLLPQTIIFSAVGLFIQGYMFGFLHYPMNCSPWTMIFAMLLFVIANQSVAVFVCGVIPNLRFALSICTLYGVLTFSLGAFSFPAESMYGAVSIFTWISPSRFYFLIDGDQALNGFDLYYSKVYFAALMVFNLLPWLTIVRLKKAQLNPVYVP